VTGQGRLVIQTSEDPAARWLVTFEGSSWKDEDISEESLGPIVGKLEENEVSKKADDQSLKSKKKTPNKQPTSKNDGGIGKAPRSTSGTSSNSSAEENSDSRKKKSKKENSQTDSDASSPKSSHSDPSKNEKSNRLSISDREQRSRRRQAIIEEDTPTTTATTTTSTKRPRPPTAATPPSKKVKTETGEEVIKVPMLTGTLYLYRRGLRRRAEFIRKY
jgi:hypothetical protein